MLAALKEGECAKCGTNTWRVNRFDRDPTAWVISLSCVVCGTLKVVEIVYRRQA